MPKIRFGWTSVFFFFLHYLYVFVKITLWKDILILKITVCFLIVGFDRTGPEALCLSLTSVIVQTCANKFTENVPLPKPKKTVSNDQKLHSRRRRRRVRNNSFASEESDPESESKFFIILSLRQGHSPWGNRLGLPRLPVHEKLFTLESCPRPRA